MAGLAALATGIGAERFSLHSNKQRRSCKAFRRGGLMGLFDGYYDPDQFETSGGLLGRLLSPQRLQGMPPDIEPSASSPAFQAPMSAPMMPAPGTRWPTPNPQTPFATLRSAFGDHNRERSPLGLQFGQAATMQPLGNGLPSGDADIKFGRPLPAGRLGRVSGPDPARLAICARADGTLCHRACWVRCQRGADRCANNVGRRGPWRPLRAHSA